MEKYLIYLNKSGKIKEAQQSLILQCLNFAKGESGVYESFTFIDGTGYTKTVKDEIDFVIASQQLRKINILSSQEFITMWGFEDYLKFDVAHLSGGWKKYLGLALFSNIKSETKVYFDSCRQLSDRLITRFISNLENTNIKYSFFIEWDAMLLSGMDMKVLYDTPSGLQPDPYLTTNSDRNYE